MGQDWKEVREQEDFKNLGTVSVFDEDRKTCTVAASVHYKILYAQMGYGENPQNYILSI